jgi:hypothetical protein
MRAVPIIVMTAMAACFGQVVGRAFDELGAVSGLVLGALTGLAAATIATIRPHGTPGITWKRLEFALFPTAAVFILALSGGTTTFVPILAAIGIVVVVRTLVESTFVDLTMLERFLDDRPTGAPADRIRLRMLAAGVFLAAVAGYAIGLEAGFSDLARPAVGEQVLSIVIWFALGIVGVGVVARRARQRAWSVNGVDVSEGLADRWAAGIAAVAALVVAVSLATPLVTGQLSAAPAQAINGTDGLDRFVTRALELLSRDANGDQTARPNLSDENGGSVSDLIEPSTRRQPEWLGDVVLAAVIATVFVWAIKLGRNARFAQGGRPVGSGGWEGFLALLSGVFGEVRALLAGFGRWLRLLRGGRRHSPGEPASVRSGSDERAATRWSPGDPVQRRIARSFAHVVDLEPSRPGETPAEVAGTVGRRTDPDGASVVLDGYLRARYSTGRVAEHTAAEVEAAARRVTDAARHDGEG